MSLKKVKPVVCLSAIAVALLFQGCATKAPDAADQAATEGSELPPVEESAPQVEPAVVEQPAQVESTTYVVKSGDTLSAIAVAYGLRLPDITAINPNLNPDKIRVGQKILLPGKVEVKSAQPVVAVKSAPDSKTTVYVVKGGDSLSLIAKRHGCKVSCIKEANGLKSDVIRVGQKLKVPATKTTPAKSAKAKPAPKANVKPATVVTPKATPAVASTPAPTVPAPAVQAETPAPAPVAPAPAPTEVKEAPVAVPPVAPTVDSAKEVTTYTVKEGDDIYSIAMRWAVSPTEIKTLNGLEGTVEKIVLKPGQVLKIPAAE